MLSREDQEIARRAVLIDSMPADVADFLLRQANVQARERGSSIFLQGEPAHNVYIVLSGWVKLYRIAPNGAEAVVGVFTKGRSFGEAVAFRNSVYPVAAEAVTDCRLLAVRASSILNMMEKRPELCSAMLAATFGHLHALVTQVEQLKAQTGAQRVAEFLLDLCPVDEGACAVTLPYEKVLIAGRLGMKPESLSRAFARLKEAGVTISQNHAAISDVERLRTYVEQDRAAAWGHAL
ncbi:Crp/Fnr family transcriptional regulator [Limibaculum sp. FT325]|uniref:Crp/Fnr family transcriptional regulator n=1 Tax=Thermohalobaculum sediminis TaxID=2939436 RepID=UPI0020C12802|nr:Crp/Fnr family transcriptional regulator [Limibaculum sediminis]MCL5778393.1 Crp/Fnr family transcriptional regulator [Limibaculum sediminis]